MKLKASWATYTDGDHHTHTVTVKPQTYNVDKIVCL